MKEVTSCSPAGNGPLSPESEAGILTITQPRITIMCLRNNYLILKGH